MDRSINVKIKINDPSHTVEVSGGPLSFSDQGTASIVFTALDQTQMETGDYTGELLMQMGDGSKIVRHLDVSGNPFVYVLREGDLMHTGHVDGYLLLSDKNSTTISYPFSFDITVPDGITQPDIPPVQDIDDVFELVKALQLLLNGIPTDIRFKGPKGDSDYDLAKQVNPKLTLEDWLESLKGESAYQLAKDQGYIGSMADWLVTITAFGQWRDQDKSRKDATEDDFFDWLSAFGLWKRQNNKPDAKPEDFLQDLSAYGSALRNGFAGTEDQWLASFSALGLWKRQNNKPDAKPEDFLQDLSAYGAALRNGFVGTESQWLASLSAFGEWKIQTNQPDAGYSDFIKAISGPQGIKGDGVRFHGQLDSKDKLPATGTQGDAYTIGGHMWTFDGDTKTWMDDGPLTVSESVIDDIDVKQQIYKLAGAQTGDDEGLTAEQRAGLEQYTNEK
ncbi:hypothetical protein [Schleiferilactobacillus shenzhenensis]|uniref:BppU N-terminal domain-containing protein n=1 Tax=Schleiferilactobacillus shenzhenensis LY-73 TaxID=1231336 RepID=U4TK77_9LACO|nr:hypothetical protein [Schleiferilactobacillus shenzhenensis]ERL63775.1 hypothetical protein L248_2192 [Schleiferilactobacillus shenzhenensis LY-73]